MHENGSLPVPWLLDLPEHAIAKLIADTNAMFEDLESDA